MLKLAFSGWPSHGYNRGITKICLVMKLTFVLLTAAFLNVSAEVHSQRISYSGKNVSLATIFEEVEKQTGYAVTYRKGTLAGTKPVTINVSNSTLQEFLTRILAGQPVKFTIAYKTIFLARKENTRIITDLPGKEQPARSTPINGRVTDAGGNPLVGATITIRGNKASVITDELGRFSLDATEGNVLLISYVGYEEKQVKVTAALLAATDRPLVVMLTPIVEALDGVVVHTGYQELPKERVTGSFVKVDKGLITRSVGPNILDRLEGVVSGMQFNRHPLKRENITIRGRTTIFANADILVVVDGFPYDGDISNINPNDVESITILKDAAAASIWGVRAGNGVVVIETKKGKTNMPGQLSVGATVNIGNRPDLLAESRVSSADYIRWETWLFDQGRYNSAINSVNKTAISPAVEILWKKREGLITDEEAQKQLDALGKNDVRHDLMKYLYRNSLQQQYYLNYSGGADKIGYYISANYDKNLSNHVAEDYRRITVTSNTTYRPLPKLEIMAGLNYIRTTTHNNSMLVMNPWIYERLVDENGQPAAIVQKYRYSWITAPEQQRLPDWQYRPLEEAELLDDVTRGSDTRLTLNVNYTLLPGLKAEARYQFQQFNLRRRNHNSEATFITRDFLNYRSQVNPDGSISRPFNGGMLYLEDKVLVSNAFRGQLSFNRSWQRHGIAAVAGAEMRETKSNSSTNQLYGYDDEYGTHTTINFEKSWPVYFNPNSSIGIGNNEGVDATLNRYISYYANASYTFMDRYVLSASARKDASNLFGVNTNHRSVPLWSAGISWEMSREKFYRINPVPYLRLRVTYGYNGNVLQDATALLTAAYTTSYLNRIPYAIVTSSPNPELRWEKVSNLNVGIDFKAFNNRISGSLEWYRKNGKDLFGNIALAPSSGVERFNTNSANTRVDGFDITLNTVNINGAVKWETVFLVSMAKEKVTRYLLKNTTTSALINSSSFNIGTFPVEGRPIFGLYSYNWAGLDPATGDPRGYLNGIPSTDYSALRAGLSIDDLVFHGPMAPPVFGSVRNTVRWNNFSLSANILFKFGNYFRKAALSYSTMTHGDYYKRWKKPGDEKTTNVPSDIQAYPFNSVRDVYYRYSAATVEKGDHIRLSDVRLGYTFGSRLLQLLPVKAAEFFVYGRNLGLLWKANNADIDPESPVIPIPASIAFSLRIDL